MKKILLAAIAIIIIAAILFLRGDEDAWICENGQWVKHGEPSAPMPIELCGEKQIASVANFQECVEAGNPVTESYPRQCRARGQIFTEDIGNELEKSDLIKLETPRPNQSVKSPLTVKGQARGIWFFEGSFPIILTDWDGLIIGQGIAVAQGEWMTEEFVPFAAVIEFEAPKYKNNGTLILQKDNPSGLPEHDDALEIPVFFEESHDNKNVLPLSFEETFMIARENKECSNAGILTDKYIYNENSKTWWIDLERMPELEKDGCNPACVVSEETKEAEVNWRCTGLIVPKESAEEIQELFVEKYPKYSTTVIVNVDQETENHARGNVIFEAGAPGGIFLAARIDGEWQIVFDGNGQIPCNLSAYGFPNEMLADCV